MTKETAGLIASAALAAALVLTDGGYGADWPDWVRGAVLGVLAAVTVSCTVKAAGRPARNRERDRQDVR